MGYDCCGRVYTCASPPPGPQQISFLFFQLPTFLRLLGPPRQRKTRASQGWRLIPAVSPLFRAACRLLSYFFSLMNAARWVRPGFWRVSQFVNVASSRHLFFFRPFLVPSDCSLVCWVKAHRFHNGVCPGPSPQLLPSREFPAVPPDPISTPCLPAARLEPRPAELVWRISGSSLAHPPLRNS